MVSSSASTPAAYLASLPADHRRVIAAVRKVIVDNLPHGYEERMNWGMISYEIPLSRYPTTYNGHPLSYLALARQKNNYALYVTSTSGNASLMAKLAAAYKAAGRKLDMGKSCLRFRTLEELPLDVIAEIVRSEPVESRIANYETAMGPTRLAKSPTRPAARKTASEPKASAKRASPAKRAAAKKASAKKSAAKKTNTRRAS
jgi:hypothetical protein